MKERERLYMDGHAQGFQDGTEAAEATLTRYRNEVAPLVEELHALHRDKLKNTDALILLDRARAALDGPKEEET